MIMSSESRNNIVWDDYFMALACLASKRSKDPCTQVGACVVNKYNRIVGVGYNGMPVGCSDDIFPWNKSSPSPIQNKSLYVCHAEMNAVINKNCADIRGCKIYTALLPCNQCAKIIIQSGLSEVVYMSEKNIHKIESKASLKMFDASGVEYRQYIPTFGGVVINFKQSQCELLIPDPANLSMMSKSMVQQYHIQRDITQKRIDYLEWEEYFMALALLVSKRSKNPVSQLGCCIVNDRKRIVSQGYNGMPCRCSEDLFSCETNGVDEMNNKDLYECHAELNAILNTSVDLRDCVMYSICFPCNECAKAMIQTGISEVVYLDGSGMAHVEIVAAKKMFDATNISYRQLKPRNETLKIDFSEINWNNLPQLTSTSCKGMKHLSLN